MMPNIDELLIGKNLSRKQARRLFVRFLDPELDQKTAKELLVLLQKKGEDSDELTGFVEAVRSLEKPIKFNARFLVDGCGTGGDGKNTFNISTLSCLIAAAAGAKVAKHGNRSISSQCGSSDLMKSLVVKIDAPQNRMLKSLKKIGFGYFHAPLYHPIFKQVQPIRSELTKKKIKTLFNLTGPFLNPIRPKSQLIGVWKKDLVLPMLQTSKNLNLKNVIVLWNTSGLDELTTDRDSFIGELRNQKIILKTLKPRQFHLKKNRLSKIKGGSVKQNKRIAVSLLSGKDRSARLDVVLLNAGAILYVSGKTKNIPEGIRLAREAVFSGAASKLLKRLVQITHGS